MPTGTLAEAQERLMNPLIEEESEEQQPTEDEVVEESTEDELPEEAAQAESEAPELYTVTVAGETREVTLDDLRSGYMMQSDYSKKTAELAEQRKQDEAAREALQQKLEQAEWAAQVDYEDFNSPAMLELKDDDPAAYYERKERYEQRLKRIDELRADQVDQSEAKRQARIVEERALLTTAIPEWLDESKMVEEVGLMQKTWADAGFTEEDLQGFIDHRMMVLSRKAALYDRIANAKPEAKKIEDEPKSASPGAAQSRDDLTSRKTKDLRQRLRSTGSMKDAQQLVKALIKE